MSEAEELRDHLRRERPAIAARAQRPVRSDLSSGGGQVRQSNRSGSSKKPREGDPSRPTDGPTDPPPPTPATQPAPPAQQKGTPRTRRDYSNSGKSVDTTDADLQGPL